MWHCHFIIFVLKRFDPRGGFLTNEGKCLRDLEMKFELEHEYSREDYSVIKWNIVEFSWPLIVGKTLFFKSLSREMFKLFVTWILKYFHYPWILKYFRYPFKFRESLKNRLLRVAHLKQFLLSVGVNWNNLKNQQRWHLNK